MIDNTSFGRSVSLRWYFLASFFSFAANKECNEDRPKKRTRLDCLDSKCARPEISYSRRRTVSSSKRSINTSMIIELVRKR